MKKQGIDDHCTHVIRSLHTQQTHKNKQTNKGKLTKNNDIYE